MKLLLKLSWRNIWRNKRRSIFTLAAIVFATLAAIAMRGIQIGTYDVNIKNAVEMYSGFLQIQRNGYQENPSLQLSFFMNEELLEKINSTEEIISYSPRISAGGLVSFQDNSYGIALLGIDPRKEEETSKILTKIKNGFFFKSDTSSEIVLGHKLLENLNAELGDYVVVLSQGLDGSLGNLKFKIVGTTKTGSPELDGMAAFIGIRTAQELLAMYGERINSIAIKLDDLENINTVKEKMNDADLRNNDLAVLTWEEIMPDFKQSIELDNISGIMMLFILIIIVAFGILNTVLMSVTERFNEFGVTLSIGMPQVKLVHLIFIETILLTGIGLILGNILGGIINYIIVNNPIEVGGDLAYIYEEYGFLPLIESSMKISIFINTSLTVLLVSIIACLYPIYKVYKLEPLKGIRYT
ncbi:ABC transporter permease [Bacteroidota bacterium]